jgi:hypothetical protein
VLAGTFAISAVLAPAALASRGNAGPLALVCDGAWHVAPSQHSKQFSFLNAVDGVTPTLAWTVGSRVGAGNRIRPVIERWDGNIWTIVPSPHVGGFTHLKGVAAADASQAWAVGDHLAHTRRHQTKLMAEQFVGGTWSIVPAQSPGPGASSLDGVAAVSDNDVWSVGFRSRPHQFNSPEALAEHWDGSRWTIVPTPRLPGSSNTQLVSVAAVGANDVWAVGFAQLNSRGPRPLAEHWNGTAWSVVPTPNPGAGFVFASVAARATDDVWAVGYANFAGVARPLAEHFDGSRWSLVKVGHPGRNAFLTGVSATPSDVYAVGGSQYHALVERWNGTAFERISVPRSRGGNLGSLGTDGSTTWGVGSRAGGKRPLVEYVC